MSWGELTCLHLNTGCPMGNKCQPHTCNMDCPKYQDKRIHNLMPVIPELRQYWERIKEQLDAAGVECVDKTK